MYNAPPPNLMQGIQLVQAGRPAEALSYLRHAVRIEAVTAEGWLWLAAATPDLDEYRYCVNQALRLDPTHPTALHMRGDLQRRTQQPAYQPAYPQYWNPPPYIPSPDEFATLREDVTATARVQRPSRGRRILRAVILLVIVGGCIAGIAALIGSGVIQDTAREWLAIEDMHTLDFTVGETPTYRFSVEVPESWLPANTDNPSWRETRDDLIAAFPPPAEMESAWEQLDESFSKAVRNPVYGEMLPPIHVVETDPDQLQASAMIAALTLTEIVPFPGGIDAGADVCARMRALESAYQIGELGLPPGGEAIDTTLAVRANRDDCVFAIRRRYTIPASFTPPTLPGQMPQAVRLMWIAVPVGAERYAAWTVTFAEANAADYDHAVERILETLKYQS